MSGHSRWSQIRHKKGMTDQKRGQLFSKLSKLISIAARKDPNPESNIELKNAVEKAKSFNMPSENIERAIKRVGEKEAAQLDILCIEAMGPDGSAFIIEAISDNRNRTISELKSILKKHGLKMVQPGSLMWLFDKSGSEFFPKALVEPSEGLKEKAKNFLEEIDSYNDVKEIYTNLIL